MSYLVVLWLHLVGAATLFGAGLGIAFFAWSGYLQGPCEGNMGLVRGVLQSTVVADATFTAVAAVAQPVTGFVLWRITGGTWPDPWLAAVLVLYVFVGLCWLAAAWLQIQLRDAANQAGQTGELVRPLPPPHRHLVRARLARVPRRRGPVRPDGHARLLPST